MPAILLRLALAATLLSLYACGAAPPKVEKAGPIVFPKPPDPPRFAYEATIFGTNAVRNVTEEDRLRRFFTGTTERDGIAFAKPFDVATHQGRLYVTDTVQRAIFVLDFAKQKSFLFADRGDEGDVHKPLGIAIDAKGTVYVCDGTKRAIQIYDADGNYLRSVDLSGWAARPAGIDVSPSGDRLFVIDTGGVETDDHRLGVVDANSGELIRTIGKRGKADGELNLPRDVRLGKNGLLYVTDGGNFRVQVFDQEGRFVRKWGQPGRHLGQFSRPKGIGSDPEGNIYVVDAAFGNFQIFDPDGNLMLFVGDRSTTLEPAKFMLPAGIDVDEDGRVYLVDQFFRKIDVFRPISLAETTGWFGKRARDQ
ncbi:MAG: SMP-30/gluconolactonase/LRE family protein [Chromatiales bacterium]|nr:SMP-30/gluconolactonase/LRE family protein [Chromatiales bacterium]